MTKKFLTFVFIAGLALQLHAEDQYHVEDQFHVVKDDDTLYGIAKQYSVSLDLLLEANDDLNPSRLYVGEKVVIPSKYIVQAGDTLYGIARKLGLRFQELIEINDLSRDYMVKEGEKLLIPGAAIEKGDDNGTIVQKTGTSASTAIETNYPTSIGDLLWPHPGSRIALEGRLRGISINGRIGDPIISVSSGKVIWLGPYRSFGNVVFVESNSGYVYVYGGNGPIDVAVGDFVEKGEKLGTLGTSGLNGNNTVYFIVYKDGIPVSPDVAPRI